MTRHSPEGAFSARDALPHRSSEELRELNRRASDRGDWRNAARGYKDQRDVLQAELDATRAVLAHRTADLDAVVAERDAALERVAELEAVSAPTKEERS
jgi:hypothetical protein